MYEFLAAQKAESFREIELKKTSKIVEIASPDKNRGRNDEQEKQRQKELKKLERQVKESEKKIAELESTISHVEFRLSKPELLSESESKEIYSHYERYKQQLEEEMNLWGELTEKMEKQKA